MYYRLILIIGLQLVFGVIRAQYICKAMSVCSESGEPSDTILLYVKYYNQKDQLIREEHNTAMEDYQQPHITLNVYGKDDLLQMTIDSNIFNKMIRKYSYKEGKISQVLEISSNLSTENFSPERPLLLPDDSIPVYVQPDIRYVWRTDTVVHTYRYNVKGLLTKISKKSKDDIYERTETFEYDEKNRLIRSFISDQYLYKYYYDGNSRLIKKEKFNNSYIDDSGIGPDLKPESVRLKKALWSLSDTYKMSYNTAGQLTKLLEYSRSEGSASLTENHFYDQKGRRIQTTSNRIFADAYFPLCTIFYQYE